MDIFGNGLKKVLNFKSANEFLIRTGGCHFLRFVRQRQLVKLPLLKRIRLYIAFLSKLLSVGLILVEELLRIGFLAILALRVENILLPDFSIFRFPFLVSIG